MKRPIFIIEHLEKELYPWCIIEYKHISKKVGKKNLWLTNIRNKDAKKLAKYGKIINYSVKKLRLDNPCILDPESNEQLTPKKAKQFNYFIFGGILGDYPAKKRTKNELSMHLKRIKKFNLGDRQMSTDNAVYAVSRIIKGIRLEKIQFKDEIEIKINKVESTILPYRYALIKGKPLISKELVRFLKKS